MLHVCMPQHMPNSPVTSNQLTYFSFYLVSCFIHSFIQSFIACLLACLLVTYCCTIKCTNDKNMHEIKKSKSSRQLGEVNRQPSMFANKQYQKCQKMLKFRDFLSFVDVLSQSAPPIPYSLEHCSFQRSCFISLPIILLNLNN